MKKLLTVFLLLTITLFLTAQIKPHAVLETGYEDRTVSFLHAYNGEELQPVYHEFKELGYAKMEMAVTAGQWFSIYTSNKILFKPVSLVAYNPKYAEFIIGTSLKHRRFEIYYEHMCFHSIGNKVFSDGYDRVALRIEFF